MQGSGSKDRGLAAEFNIGRMDQFTRAIGKTMPLMEKDA